MDIECILERLCSVAFPLGSIKSEVRALSFTKLWKEDQQSTQDEIASLERLLDFVGEDLPDTYTLEREGPSYSDYKDRDRREYNDETVYCVYLVRRHEYINVQTAEEHGVVVEEKYTVRAKIVEIDMESAVCDNDLYLKPPLLSVGNVLERIKLVYDSIEAHIEST
jgi:hypothetical protein